MFNNKELENNAEVSAVKNLEEERLLALCREQRLALLPSWMVQGCPSLDNPFVGTTVHRTLAFNRLTHSYGYASTADRPSALRSPCVARSPAHTSLYGAFVAPIPPLTLLRQLAPKIQILVRIAG